MEILFFGNKWELDSNIHLDIQVTRNGKGSQVWEWEGMGVPKVIPAHL